MLRVYILVNAGRKLRERIGEDDVVGADLRTIVFSATLGPKTMEIWVHWAEVLEAGTEFHMNMLASKSLADKHALPELRRSIHNILDWGCLTRMKELEDLYKRIHIWERVNFEQTIKASEAKEGGKNAKKRKGD